MQGTLKAIFDRYTAYTERKISTEISEHEDMFAHGYDGAMEHYMKVGRSAIDIIMKTLVTADRSDARCGVSLPCRIGNRSRRPIRLPTASRSTIRRAGLHPRSLENVSHSCVGRILAEICDCAIIKRVEWRCRSLILLVLYRSADGDVPTEWRTGLAGLMRDPTVRLLREATIHAARRVIELARRPSPQMGDAVLCGRPLGRSRGPSAGRREPPASRRRDVPEDRTRRGDYSEGDEG
jgi:hypothetical protein